MYNKIIRYVAFLFLVIIIYSCRSESINFFVLTVESTLYGEMTCNGFVDVDELPINLMQKLKSSGYKDGENVIAKLKIKSNILMQGSFKRKKILEGFQYYRKSIGASLKLTFH